MSVIAHHGLLRSEPENFVEEDTNLKSTETFRAATYNILSSRLYDPKGKFFNPEKDYKLTWEFRKNLVVDAIKKLNIDLLALQEVRLEQLHFLVEAFPEFGIVGFSEHSGQSLEEIQSEHLTDEDVREIVPILYRKDFFRLIEARKCFLSDTPEKVSSAPGASRPRIVTAAAFECLADNTTVIVSNTHYDHLNTTETLKKAGHQECVFLQEFCALNNPTDVLYMGDRNSFVDAECNGDEWYAEFKAESGAEDARLLATHVGPGSTFIGYHPDKFKAEYSDGQFTPKVLDTIFHKGTGKVIQSLNSFVEYDLVPAADVSPIPLPIIPTSSIAKLCPFFGKAKKPIERQFASDHTCVMVDIQHVRKPTN